MGLEVGEGGGNSGHILRTLRVNLHTELFRKLLNEFLAMRGVEAEVCGESSRWRHLRRREPIEANRLNASNMNHTLYSQFLIKIKPEKKS